MGHQITVYCSDKTFEMLEPIPGETKAAKIRTAIELWDSKQQEIKDWNDARLEAMKTQLETLKKVLRFHEIDGWWNE